MSKIIHSGSGVAFETVTFLDLDIKKAGNNTFVSSKMGPETNKSDFQKPANTQPDTDKTPPAPQEEIDLESLKQEAYEKGKKEGRQEAEKTLQTATQALTAGLEELNELRESIFTRSKEDMVRLIMGIAKRVVQTEVREKEEIIAKTVLRALTAAVQSEEYTIRVHPEDLESVKENKPLFMARIKGLERIHFLADESVSRGGCLAESRVGDVDASLETQLQEMQDQLKAEVGS